MKRYIFLLSLFVLSIGVLYSCEAIDRMFDHSSEGRYDFSEENMGYVRGGDKDLVTFNLGDIQKLEGHDAFVGWLDDSQADHIPDTTIVEADTIVFAPGDTLFVKPDTVVTKDFMDYARRRIDFHMQARNANVPDIELNEFPAYIRYYPDDARVTRVTVESSDTSVMVIRPTDRPLKFIFVPKNLGDCNITVTLEGNNSITKTFPLRVTHTAYVVFYVSRLADLLDSQWQDIDFKITTLPDSWYPLVLYFQDSLTVYSSLHAQRWDEDEYHRTGNLVNEPFELFDTISSPRRRHVEVVTRDDMKDPRLPLGMRRKDFRSMADVGGRDRDGVRFLWTVKEKDFTYTDWDFEDGKLIFRDTTIVDERIRLKGYRWQNVVEMGVDILCDLPYVDFKYAVKLKASRMDSETLDYDDDRVVASDAGASKVLSVVMLGNDLTDEDVERLRRAAQDSKQMIRDFPRDSAKWFFDLSDYGVDVDYIWEYFK